MSQYKRTVIVQARMSSSRLPGKVLMPIAGKPMLGYLTERLSRVFSREEIVIATSDDASDDPIGEFCATAGLGILRGPLEDVAGRFVECIGNFEPDYFARICGDSPLLDTGLIEKAFDLIATTNADIVTNVHPRTYPKGQSVEVLKSKMFLEAYGSFCEPEDFEHVTAYFYRNAERFSIEAFEAEEDCSSLSLVVDTHEDFDRISGVIGSMERPHWSYGWQECVELLNCLDGTGGTG